MQKYSPVSIFTITGLLYVFLIPPIVICSFQALSPMLLTNSFVLIRESSLLGLTGILLLLIVKGEKLGLESIGLHNKHWGKSILLSFVIMIATIAVVLVCLTLFKLVGITYGKSDGKYAHVSLWVMTFMMIRAGFFEEIFYRGYMMERLNTISKNWLVYFLLPSIIFGLMHYQQGIGGIIIATAGGLVVSYFYWKKRDLKANIIAHIMVDLIPNIIIPLIFGNS